MPISYLANVQRSGAGVTMMSFVREKKWMSDGLSVVRGGPDNASEVCAKWRDHKMSQFFHLKLEQAGDEAKKKKKMSKKRKEKRTSTAEKKLKSPGRRPHGRDAARAKKAEKASRRARTIADKRKTRSRSFFMHAVWKLLRQRPLLRAPDWLALLDIFKIGAQEGSRMKQDRASD